MDKQRKEKLVSAWGKHFPGAELPIVFFYSTTRVGGSPESQRCFLGQLAAVRQGQTVCFDVDSILCPGGKRYAGFMQKTMPNFEYFLSCGIPGKLEGERYKKTPEIVREFMETSATFVAPAPFLVFKRWDMLEAADEPDVSIFFAKPDVLSGLFTLSGFDEADPNAVIAPFCAGCASIVQHPYLERTREKPRAVLGMFDVSARPWVEPNVLTFAVPMNKLNRMIDNMDESFLITPSWKRVKERL